MPVSTLVFKAFLGWVKVKSQFFTDSFSVFSGLKLESLQCFCASLKTLPLWDLTWWSLFILWSTSSLCLFVLINSFNLNCYQGALQQGMSLRLTHLCVTSTRWFVIQLMFFKHSLLLIEFNCLKHHPVTVSRLRAFKSSLWFKCWSEKFNRLTVKIKGWHINKAV